MSNKKERFSYEVGFDVCISKRLKEVLAWAVGKYFWFSNNVILLKSYQRFELKNNIVHVAMWSLVTM